MIRTRAVRLDECAAVGELTVRAFVDGGHLAADDEYEQVLSDVAGRVAQAEVLVAVDGAELLGSVTVVRPDETYAQLCGPGELEFRMLAVHPDHAGRGAGRALVRAVLDRARAEGRTRVLLSTLDSMETARRLYLGLGFGRLPELDRTLPVGAIVRAMSRSVS
ncbi:GNAT family N-acetyltransferase [Saccharopolyspora gloriosae]|uniref:GNAT family N-acetyltransferase n=1 Tax=Saccharopolyspora gloriosae TaxID=455344 RepID=UPI001FB6FE6F|nr:GNAT family N-acetyltransferase [Saccharopolyspora gloriosae]